MKKYLVVFMLLLLVLCTGCSNNKVEKEKEIYLKYTKELKKVKKSSEDIPFDIEVVYDKLTNNEVRYQVIIDNVKENIYDIEAVLTHNKQTDDIFPSIGIFDDKEKLEVGKKPAGIILVGYIDYDGKIEDFKCQIKVLIKYKLDNKKKKKVYYVTKK